jgi:hypothetical protein
MAQHPAPEAHPCAKESYICLKTQPPRHIHVPRKALWTKKQPPRHTGNYCYSISMLIITCSATEWAEGTSYHAYWSSRASNQRSPTY